MLKFLVVLAAVGTMSAALAAQTAPQANAGATQTPPAQPQTVKKKVCTRVVDEESTGSRLSNSHKVCKMVDVPADGSANAQPNASGAAGSK